MLFACGTLVTIDTALAIWALWLWKRAHGGDAPGTPKVLLYCGAALSIHFLASFPLGFEVDLNSVSGRMTYTGIFLLSGAVPALLFAMVVITAMASRATDALYGMTTHRPPGSGMSRARALVRADNLDAAADQYRRDFRETPDDPAPLFELAEAFLNANRADDAANTLREVVRHFRDDLEIWARAAFQLAQVLQDQEDRSAAAFLRREILTRAPKSHYAAWVREQTPDTSHDDTPDPFYRPRPE